MLFGLERGDFVSGIDLNLLLRSYPSKYVRKQKRVATKKLVQKNECLGSRDWFGRWVQKVKVDDDSRFRLQPPQFNLTTPCVNIVKLRSTII